MTSSLKTSIAQGQVPLEMVNLNPGLSQILSKVFLSKKFTEFSWAYSNNNMKCYPKQCIGRYNTKTEQNFKVFR